MSENLRLEFPDYQPPPLLGNPHLQTLYPTFLRPSPNVNYQRERISLPDGDFLDLDWSRSGSGRLALLCHGLVSDSRARYMRGMARACNVAGWDVVAMNLRGCSGEPNRLLRSYHSGVSEDVAAVLRHIEAFDYRAIALVGFSLGGNIILKYAGESGARIDPRVVAVAGVSVPCDLESGARRLEAPANRIYQWNFVHHLKEKARIKCTLFPDRLRWEDFRGVRTVWEFDEAYTAPVHGFRDALDYYRSCSSRRFLAGIAVPTLLLSAADDPFLTPRCYPRDEAAGNPLIRLVAPEHGGHLGFVSFGNGGCYWHEDRVVAFLDASCPEPVTTLRFGDTL